MKDVMNNLENLLKESRQGEFNYKPNFYKLSNEKDIEEFHEILKTPGIKAYDELHGQLRELVKAQHPKHKFESRELDEAAWKHIGDTDPVEYGVWIYYPWLNKLTHTLDKDEYISVRTNRNQFKIMPEERDILSTKKIGVLGLSVGQSVALALSMERCYGELRIADFDMLELSNLNRIRSGVQDLGVLKTISTARQIAEIDPFLEVKCFNDGVTEENIDSFFLDGGKLDMVLDECDGLDIKIRARQKAKELGIPVIMETSDRGMIDIERFDLEPDRPILHGLIDHLESNPDNLKGLSNEDKVPYILPIIGLDTMSDRLKASMLEVEQSITTWPQLASDVILGGAVAANACRRIALDELKASGRFFVDLNEIVDPTNAHNFIDDEENRKLVAEEIRQKEAEFLKLKAGNDQLDLSEAEIKELVDAAIWAPSGGNNQPWKWIYEQKNLYLLLDEARASSFLDYAAAGSYLSLGTATENLVLKAHEMGLEVAIDHFPDKNNPHLAAVFHFYKNRESSGQEIEKHDFDGLVSTLKTRLTNRLLRKPLPIPSEKLDTIQAIGQSVDSVKVHFVTDKNEIKHVGELISKIDRILITHKKGHHGFINEIRWSDEEAERTKDGVDIATIDLSAGEAAGFRVAKNWSVVSTLNKWGGGSVFEKLSRKGAAGASAFGLITMSDSDALAFFNGGRALERVWLQANKDELALQPMTGLTFMLHRLIDGKGAELSEQQSEKLSLIKDEFYQIFKLSDSQHPIFLFRLLIAEEPEVKSLRRPLEDVLTYKG